MAKKDSHLEKLATSLQSCIQDLFEKKHNLAFTEDPKMDVREIIEYNSRMRTFGLEKINDPCFAAAINFYRSEGHLKAQDSLGVLIVYVKEDHADKIYRFFGFKSAKNVDEEYMLNNCGELAVVICEQFKKELANLGYRNLITSPPVAARNEIAQGVEFDYNEYKYYELSFYLWKEKTLVVDITLAPA